MPCYIDTYMLNGSIFSDLGLSNEKSHLVRLNDITENHEIDKTLLNIENKVRSNLLPWKGQFSPQLIEVLLEKYSFHNYTLFDPFLGSGTILVEGSRKNLSTFGTEINPAAFHLSKIYTFCNVELDQRKSILSAFENKFSLFQKHGKDSLFFNEPENDNTIENLPEFLETGTDNNFVKLIEGLIIYLDSYKNGTDHSSILAYWRKLKNIIKNLPFTNKPIRVLNSDARKVGIEDDSIDIVITSPPYINVFNYHQQYRESAELIGNDVSKAARSEIGSNRKHRGNRFLTVIQYILDIHSVFIELKRICKNGTKIIFIVGRESNVRKTSFFNSEIISSIALIAGFKIEFREERVFTNRFGQQIYEDLIHFENQKIHTGCSIDTLRELSCAVLVNSIERAPDESLSDLKKAIESVSLVKESPLY